MTALMEVIPTGSYALLVPRNVEEDIDADVTSFWLDGDDLVLQLSSRTRSDGQQVSAGERMRDRLDMHAYSSVAIVPLEILGCPDAEAASAVDEDGTHWLFVYAVWPALAVFVTVTHPSRDVAAPSWAIDAVRSIRLS